MNKKVNRKQTGPQSRERILRAAEQLFARHGFAGTGLRELAAAADVNLAMINYFFGSKKALLKEILDIFLSGYLAVACRELAGDADLQVKIRRYIESVLVYFELHRDALLVTITELPHDDPEILEYKAAWGRQMMEVIDREICRPVQDETGNTFSPLVIGPLLTSMLASRFLFAPVMERVQADAVEGIQAREYAEIISCFFLKGLSSQEK